MEDAEKAKIRGVHFMDLLSLAIYLKKRGPN